MKKKKSPKKSKASSHPFEPLKPFARDFNKQNESKPDESQVRLAPDIDLVDGKFTLVTPAHDERLIQLGWRHVGVDGAKSFFETASVEAVRSTIAEFKFRPSAAATRALG